ncbi:MAG: DegT/DnrJ/EryC1/StrS family aminotransferase [Acidimicrobiia bacterium]|nr:DegT/DnrJ/EryC1/StrS family aminotransferase [Acidimicrobiia bacterium]
MIPLAMPLIGDDEIAAVNRVMRSGMLAQGSEVAAFEEEFAAAEGANAAAAVSNGTTALIVALQALGIEPGDEVIVPSFTFAATANAVATIGAIPVFADCDPDTFCIDPDHAASLVTTHTRALIAVHLYGHMAAMGRLHELARDNELYLVEDAAQAHGAERDGHRVGSLSDLATYSFYPTKNMTTGEGGMVTGRDLELVERIRRLRNHGMTERYHHATVGTNARMTDIAAAIGRVQLRRLEIWNRQRRAIAATYDLHLAGNVAVPFVAADTYHVYHQYTVRSSRRRDLVESCEETGVGYGIYYPIPCHQQAAFDRYSSGRALPHTESASEEVLSLPVRPNLTEAEIEQVIDAVNKGAKE